MPVRILTVNRKFESQLKNGDTFALNPGDDASYLLGSVGELIRATFLVDVSWLGEATPQDLWTTFETLNPVTQVGNVTEIRRGSGSFLEDGFNDGDTVDFFAQAPPNPADFGSTTIQSVSDDTLILDADIGDGGGITYGSSDFDGGNQTVMNLIGTQDLTALKWKWNIVENNESLNFESKVDGTEQSFFVVGIGLGGPRSTAFVVGESSELFKGWVTGPFKARYVTDPRADVQRFEIQMEFLILPIRKRGDEQSVFELLESLNSTKFVFEADFRTVLSDENSSKTVSDVIKRGSVANFGEVFNGQNTQYSITSVVIEDSDANIIDTLELGTVNTVTVLVASADATFAAPHPVIINHQFNPTAEVFTQNPLTYQEIWLHENKRQLIGAGTASGTIITDVVVTLNSASEIEVVFKITYSTAQQAVLTDDDQFSLWINVGDDSLTTTVSDKTALPIAEGTYTKNTDVPDLMDVTQMGYFDHPTDFLAGFGFSNYIGAVEDGILVEVDFDLDLDLAAFLELLNIDFIAFNPITGESFLLQNNPVDLTSQVLNNEGAFSDVQQINIDTTRGFKLPAGDQFNFFKMTTAALAGVIKSYNLQFGVKADWREWLPLPTADTDFLDIAEPNNGLNKKISNYMALGYEIRIVVNAAVSNGAVSTDYRFLSPTVKIFDYGDSDALDWVCTIETFNPANFDMEGNISSTEFTRIKATFDSASITVTDVADYWGIIRIEPENNLTQENIEELSSERSGVQVILVPLALETQTKKSIESGNLVLECLVDPAELVQGTNYKPSARHGLVDASAPPAGGKLKEDGASKFKEVTGDSKFKE